MEALYDGGATGERRVTIDGWDYAASDVDKYERYASNVDRTAEDYRSAAKAAAEVAENYRETAQRIREELARTEHVTLNTRSLSVVNGSVQGSAAYISVPLSNGSEVMVGTRVYGPHEGTGLWLGTPPTGYAWSVVYDGQFDVLILRKQEANVANDYANTPDDRYTW